MYFFKWIKFIVSLFCSIVSFQMKPSSLEMNSCLDSTWNNIISLLFNNVECLREIFIRFIYYIGINRRRSFCFFRLFSGETDLKNSFSPSRIIFIHLFSFHFHQYLYTISRNSVKPWFFKQLLWKHFVNKTE